MKHILLLLLLSACGPTNQELTSCGTQRYTNLPIRLAVSSTLNDIHIKALEDSIQSMHSQTGKYLFFIENRNVDAIGRISDWVNLISVAPINSGKNIQGLTTIYMSNGSVREADMTIEASLHPSYDLQSLYMHELGHMLGLDHNPDYDSIMYRYLASNRKRHVMTKEDVEAIKCTYGY